MSEHYGMVPYLGGVAHTQAGPRATASAPVGACAALANLALVGAVVGGAAAAARNAQQVRQGRLEVADALLATGRSAAASAAATAVAGMAAHALARAGVLRVALMFGLGTAVFYGLGPWIEGDGGRAP
ncbi:MAG: hypothetical protein RMN53_17175 [Anaerolineae bacterium]|nr:hypothetical protein [Anaerolineae bacterium]